MYGQEISVTASERAGYAFNWDDNDTAYTKTFILTGAVTLEPIYTANQNTAYTVKHYKQQLDGAYLSEPDETDDLTGTTDTNVTPATRSYTGFTAPSAQTDSISGDGSTVFNYYYTRDKHNLTLTNTDYIQEGDISGEYYYGEQITLTATGKQGHTFTGWTGGANTTSITVTMGVEDITIGPEYSINSYTYTVGENITSSLPSGTYQYGTSITVSANEIPGYTFTEWEDGTTTSARVIVLSDNTSISATYTANTDTVYTVHHRYQTLNNTYEVEDVTEHGTTDTTVEAPLSPRTGFVNPEVQQVKILGTGLAEVTYTYNRKTYTFEIGDHVTSTLEPGTYMHGTTITVTADTRPGYTFEEWEDETLTSTRVIVLTSNVTAVPAYTANTNTAYVVKHYKQQLDGTYSSEPDEIDSLTGTTELSVTPSTKSYTGFTAPSTQTKQISGDGTTVFNYKYERNKYNLILQDAEYIQEGDISNEYYYEEQVTITAKTKTGYTFSKWSNDETANPLTITMGADDITIGPVYTINSYTITFDTQGGSPQPAARVITYNSPVGTLDDNVTKEGFTFDGWYDAAEGGTLITSSTLVTQNDIYYAHWEETTVQNIICKKALSLHSETCDITNTAQGCRGAGYAAGETITYGNIIRSDTLQPGDAFDCNVDGTGYNKRFYYLRTIDDKAVLIYNKNVADSIKIPDDPASYLPTTSTWSNLSATFSDDRVARFPSVEDLFAATGLNTVADLGNGSLDPINFIFENTSYALTTGHSTVWVTRNGELAGRYHRNYRNYNVPENLDTSSNSVRPVIEIPLTSIEDEYIVKFEPNGGTLTNQYERVLNGSILHSLPTPIKDGYHFVGWYDTPQFSNLIDENHVPTGYETYYARYTKSVETAELEYDEFDLVVNEVEPITFTDSTELEPRTYSSNDDSVATVDSSGNITAHAVGTTSIIVTGTLSGTSQTVVVRVHTQSVDYTIDFDEDGGEEVSNMTIPRNATIGSVGNLPTTTKEGGYTFGGWYTDTMFTKQITEDTVVKSNITAYAKWIPNDAVVEVNHRLFYTTVQAAVDDAPYGTTAETAPQTKMRLLKDVTVSKNYILNMFDNGNNGENNTKKHIVLDMQGHSFIKPSSANGDWYILRTKGILELKNGSVEAYGNKGAVEADTGGTLILDNMYIEAKGSRQAVYNDGGTIIIKNGTQAKAKAAVDGTYKRGTVQNNSGTMRILDAEITSTTYYAVSIIAGTVEIGEKDGVYDTSDVVIKGNQYGIYSEVNYSLYDGMIMGKTAAVNDESLITSIEDNATKVNDTADGYNRLYYTLEVVKHKVTLETDGGTGVPEFITVDDGDPVTSGDIGEPTKGVYTFDGWYYDAEYQNPVTFPFTPSSNVTLHAAWSYTPSDTPVPFDMTNDAISDYFSSINTWKSQITVSSSKSDVSGYTEVLNTSTFDASMRANFDAHNCSNCGTDANQNNCNSPSAGNYCDRSKGYDTGVSEPVNVYEYNSSTDTETLITYTTSNNGIIYNMIPGKIYRWESTNDGNIYGYVAPTATRRTIYSSVRNVRDLGGMDVSFTRGGTTKTGTIKYGRLYRGAQLSGGQSDVDSLTKLGITREVDLRVQNEGTNPVRLPKHDKCDSNCSSLTSDQDIIMANYLIYPESYPTNYTALRNTMKYVMTSVVNGDNIYFHCTIGTDRTGTLAYFLEGLLGVSEEDKLEDYELTYFYGLLNRTRYHDYLNGSDFNPRFLSMYKTYDTNEKIYNFYMYGLTEEQIAEENVLIEQFRDAMIDYD